MIAPCWDGRRDAKEWPVDAEALGWYASIFAWLFFTGIGLPPVPEEAGILYAAGLNALHPVVRWPVAWAMTGLGIVCADMVLYGVGRWWGVKLFEHRWVKKVMHEKRRTRIERKFHRHDVKLLLLARFLPPLRTGVFLIAGATRFSFVKFLLADAVYAVFGVGLFFLGGTWLIDLIRRSGHLAIYIVAAPAVGYALYRYYRHLKTREERPEVAPPVSVVEVPAPSTAAAKD
jgi:membrane protein DedA with SNARE-associated domain